MGKHGQLFALNCMTLFALAACDLKRSGRAKPAVVLVVALDASESTDVSRRCDEAVARIRPLVDDRRLRRLDILVLGTGDAATGGEPRAIVPWTTYVPARGLYETPQASERLRADWVASVGEACRAAIRPSKASPVYEIASRSLASIHAHCAELEHVGFACARKALAVHSDFRSTFGAFGRYLKALAKRPKRPPPPPSALDLADVTPQLCGFSNTDAGDGLPADIVLLAWQTALGPTVVIDPVCPVDRAPTPQAAR